VTNTAREDTVVAALSLPNKLVQSYLNAFVQFHAAQWQMWVHMSAWALPGGRSAATMEALPKDGQQHIPAVAEVTAASDVAPSPEPPSVAPSPVESSTEESSTEEPSAMESSPAVLPAPVEPGPVESTVPSPAPITDPPPALIRPRKRAAKPPSSGTAAAKAPRPRTAKAKAAQGGADPAPVRKRIRQEPGDLASRADGSPANRDGAAKAPARRRRTNTDRPDS